MNTTGCPSGFATDVFFRDNDLQACDIPLPAYYVYTFFIVALKYLLFARITQNWWARRSSGRGNNNNTRMCARIPLALFMYFMFALVNTLIAILGGQNIINFRNGWSLALYSLAYLQFAWTYTNGLIKLVSLGEKIIPKSHRQLASASFTGSSLVLIVLGPIMPNVEDIFFAVGLYFKALYAAASVAGYVYHLERCIRVIKEVDRNIRGYQTSATSELDDVVRKMRATQLLHVVIGLPAILPMILLAAGAIPASVWLVLLPAALEAIGNVYYAISLRGRSSKAKQNENGDLIISPMSPSASNSRSSKVASPTGTYETKPETVASSVGPRPDETAG